VHAFEAFDKLLEAQARQSIIAMGDSMKIRLFIGAAWIALAASHAQAKPFQAMFPGKAVASEQEKAFLESLDYKDGKIPLGTSGVELNVPKKFYYLSPEDSRRVLVDVWRNPPAIADGVLGMVFPANKTPTEDAWAAVIRYDEDGYVSDADAEKIDYTTLLKDMQQATEEGSKERVSQGYPGIRLVGWASAPYYDKAEHKLHWAKELAFTDAPDQNTLNYDVRALGRKGVLSMNFIAEMPQIAEIKQVIPAVMAMPQFQVGSRYQDYIPGTDQVAAYGIGGLIAGKVLSKAGLLAMALVFLKKGWIFILLGLGALGRYAMRFFRKSPEV
jgi:uncharacterized membrane-anchored protein